MRSPLINFTLTETQASFYLHLLKEYQRGRKRIDQGVAQDIMFLITEMEIRGWDESI